MVVEGSLHMGAVTWDGGLLYCCLTESLTEVRDASGSFVLMLLAIRERVLLVEAKYVCVALTNYRISSSRTVSLPCSGLTTNYNTALCLIEGLSNILF